MEEHHKKAQYLERYKTLQGKKYKVGKIMKIC